MKLINVLTISFLLIASMANAQKIKLGPELGFNMIGMESNDLGTSFAPGFHGGVNFEFNFTDNFYLRSGIFATQKRQAYSSNDTILVNLFGFEDLIGIDGINLESYTATSGRVTQLYIELPVMAGYKYKGFSVYAGPYFAYMLSARKKEIKSIDTPFLRTVDIGTLVPDGFDADLLLATLPPAEGTTSTESTSKANLRPFDMGLKAGISYEFNNLAANINYQYGFSDYQTASADLFQRHSYFQLTLNYNFGIGK
ncbi:MAG: outer membrane beta-barrel protein [Crocinitomix sp.]|nr:outer membrane beta-barrel protein [Crocinitomix sp.]